MRVKVTASTQYDVFISYKRDTDQTVGDGKLAVAVERGLTRLKRPLFWTRALNVFRDASDLAASPNLWQSVANALDASTYLFLVASPEARGSEWINREIQHWRAHKPAENVLITCTDHLKRRCPVPGAWTVVAAWSLGARHRDLRDGDKGS